MPHQTYPTKYVPRQQRNFPVKQMEALQIPVLMPDGSTRVLDLSKEDAVNELLTALSGGGYVVLKGATDIESLDQDQDPIIKNKYINAILSRIEDGDFAHSYRLHQITKDTRKYGRDPGWQKLAKDKRALSLFCDHLGGDNSKIWFFEWDPGLREDTTGKTSSVMLGGQDIIIYNSWLYHSTPRPVASSEPAILIHVAYWWKNYNNA